MTGVLFLFAIFLSPIAGIIPSVATAPALILVGYLMFTQIKDIDVTNIEDGIPALLTMILMPLTYDITVGIGAGFIDWVVIKVARRQGARDPSADVGRCDPVPRVLHAGLVSGLWAAGGARRLTFVTPRHHGPAAIGRRSFVWGYHPLRCSNGPSCPTGRA